MFKEIKIEKKFDILSNLREELRKVEPAHFATGSDDIHQARENLIAAVRSYMNSRYHLGRALRAYRAFFKSERMWVEAAKVIAASIGRSERTLFRMIEDFERASQLPAITIEAMQDQNIDPAAGKHMEKVEELLKMPEPQTREEAATAVTAVVKRQAAQKRKRVASVRSKADPEVFADGIVKQFEDRYGSLSAEERDAVLRYVLERVVNKLRSQIRELRQYSRPALVPKPVTREAA